MSAAPPPATTPPSTEQPHGAGPGPRRLTRRLEGRLIGGVASGLAAYLGVDVVLVRIALVVLAFLPFPGFGVLVYGAMLLLVPVGDDPDGTVPSSPLTERGAGFWIGLGLVVLATWSLLGASASAWAGGRLLPLLLIGVGIALWVDADRRGATRRAAADAGAPASPPVWTAGPSPTWAPPGGPPSDATEPDVGVSGVGASDADVSGGTPGPATGPGEGAARSSPSPGTTVWDAAGTTSRVAEPPVGWPPSGPPAPPIVPPTGPAPTWEAPPPVVRERSPLGRITLGLALLAGGTAWLLDLTGVLVVPVASVLAVVLAVLGVGLLIGSVIGRARWLAIVVAVLLPLTFVASAAAGLGIDVRGGVDSRTVIIDQPAGLDRAYRIGAGDLTLDLTGLEDPSDGRLDASVGAGELIVIVPEGAGVAGTARVEVGEVRSFGAASAGVSVERELDVVADPSMPTFVLDLRAGAGTIEVRSAPPTVDESTATPADDEEVRR